MRITAAADGSLRMGRALPGRGAWLCRAGGTTVPSPACVERAARTGGLQRTLRRPVDPAAVRALAS